MSRVKYPFIVKYKGPEYGTVYAKEPDGNFGFHRVQDQLDATIYRSLKEFKAGFEQSPTAWVKANLAFGHDVELIYVGL